MDDRSSRLVCLRWPMSLASYACRPWPRLRCSAAEARMRSPRATVGDGPRVSAAMRWPCAQNAAARSPLPETGAPTVTPARGALVQAAGRGLSLGRTPPHCRVPKAKKWLLGQDSNLQHPD